MDAEKKRWRVRVLEPRPSLRSGSRHLTWFLVADLAFALPLSQRRYGMAMNHRVVFSLRVEGPPARKSRLSAVRVSSEFVTLQRERGDRSAGFFFFCVASWARSNSSDGRRKRGGSRVGGHRSAHAQLLSVPCPPCLNSPPVRGAQVSQEEVGSRGVQRPPDRCVNFLETSLFSNGCCHVTGRAPRVSREPLG